MSESICANEYRTTVVCIDDYQSGIMSGRFYNPHLKQGERFHSIMDFLRRMEKMLNEMNAPQAFSTTRTFAQSTSPETEPADAILQNGSKATFKVRIAFRQNASWQGSVTWQEEDTQQDFRSLYELLVLMDSALKQN